MRTEPSGGTARATARAGRVRARAALHRLVRRARLVGARPARVLVAPLCLAWTAAPALAEPERLDPIDVVAEPAIETGDVVDEEHAIARSRIDGVRLAEPGASLREVLHREAGVQTRAAGGFGGFAVATIRAASGAQTGVYLDGIRLNDGAQPTVDLGALEALNLAALDVYRGATPLALGHEDIGGAVHLKTLAANGTEGASGRLATRVGSFGARGAQLSGSARRGRWDAVGAISRRSADNDFPFDNDNGTPLNGADDRRERRANAAARRDAALARVGRAWSEAARSDVLVQLTARRLGVPEIGNAPDNRARYDTELAQVHLAHRHDGLGVWNTRQTLFLHVLDARYDDRASQVGLAAQDNASETRTLGWKSLFERPAERGTLALVAEVAQERFSSRDALADARDVDAERERLALSARYARFALDERLTVIPALHADLIDDRVVQGEGTLRDPSLSGRSRTLGARLGLRYRLGENLQLRANGGRYARAPSFGERFGDSGLLLANPALEAERGLNLDVALVRTRGSTVTLELGAFASLRDETIVTAYDAQGIGRAVNVGEARVVGVELAARRRLGPFALAANLTWQDARQRERALGFRNKRLPGEARVAASTRLDYERGPWRLWHALDLALDRHYDRANLLPAEDALVQDVGLAWRRRALTLALAIENVGDVAVEEFNGYPRPGRALHASLALEL